MLGERRSVRASRCQPTNVVLGKMVSIRHFSAEPSSMGWVPVGDFVIIAASYSMVQAFTEATWQDDDRKLKTPEC